MAIPALPAIAWFLTCFLTLSNQVVSAGLPELNPQETRALEQVQDGPDVQGPLFALMSEHVLNSNGTNGSSDEPVRIRMSVASILAAPEDVRGAIFRVEGGLLESRRMGPPHQDIEEWMIRTVSGEPLIVYLPSSQASGFKGDGRLVSIEARFFRNIQVRSRDGLLRRYPTFFGVHPSSLGRSKAMVWEQMDILMLLGFMILLVVVGLVVMTMARRQGRTHPVRKARLIQIQSPISDDPVAALKQLRSQSERSQS